MNGRQLVVGVTGGVACFKSAALVSLLAKAGANVTVVMSPAAEKFVGAATFAALSGQPVVTDIFDSRFPLGAHIELAEKCDLLCVAPATADFLAKAAHGFADDAISTLYLAFNKPVLMAPAMNSAMWNQPAVQRNVAQLVADGVNMIGPGEGWLACRQVGSGRMSEAEELFEAVRQRLKS